MQKVDGIGGFFFVAREPAVLAQWYSDHLGIDPPPASYDGRVWTQQSGPTVFAAFPQGAEAPVSAAGWGLNLRVADLDSIVEQLRAADIAVDVDDTLYPNGRFASLRDPEGNALQLWQPG